MIKANELRIGNIFEDDTINKPNEYVVESIHSNGVNIEASCDNFQCASIEGVEFKHINPIPLTEEWLIKLGFHNKRWNNIYENEYDVIVDLGKFGLHLSATNTLEVKHVHQLQNLYFALTGQELTINLQG